MATCARRGVGQRPLQRQLAVAALPRFRFVNCGRLQLKRSWDSSARLAQRRWPSISASAHKQAHGSGSKVVKREMKVCFERRVLLEGILYRDKDNE